MEMQERMANIYHLFGGADVLERNVNLDLIVSDVKNIQVVINGSLVYVAKDEYDIKMQELDSSIENINKNLEKKANKKKTFSIVADTEWEGEEAPYVPELDIIWGDTVEQRKKQEEEYNKIRKIDSKKDAIVLTCDEEKPVESLNLRIEVMD